MKIRLSRFPLPGIAAAAALLATLLAAPREAASFAQFTQDQVVKINATGFTQVLFNDFELNQTSVSQVGFGERQVTYFLNLPESIFDLDYTGAYLYDYDDAQFVSEMYVTAGNEF